MAHEGGDDLTLGLLAGNCDKEKGCAKCLNAKLLVDGQDFNDFVSACAVDASGNPLSAHN